MAHLDHINFGVQNMYKTASRLREEHGLDSYDGGYHPHGPTANRIVPLGNDTYLELGGIVEYHGVAGNSAAERLVAATEHGDRLLFWYLRADSEKELEGLAKAHGGEVRDMRPGRILPDGTGINVKMAPDNLDPSRGLPSWFWFEQMAQHPSRVKVKHAFDPQGVAWLEVGGKPSEVEAWVGKETFARLPLRFVDRPVGLFAVAVAKPGGGEVVIRPE
jgi:hypothetical protein